MPRLPVHEQMTAIRWAREQLRSDGRGRGGVGTQLKPGDRVAERRAKRLAFFRDASALAPFVSVEVGEEVLFVSTRDSGPGKALFVDGWRTDMSTLRRAIDWLAAHGVALPPEPVFLDVGANIGTTTVMALRRQGFARAVALEPSPWNYKVLLLNLAANQLDSQVVALAAAASDSEGTLTFEVGSPNWGGHRVALYRNDDQPTITVESVTLDKLVRDGVVEPDRVGLLWIDASRHEGAVLVGASALLEASVPMVVAIRPVPGKGRPRPWDVPPEIRPRVLRQLEASYTHVVELRDKSSHQAKTVPIDELDALVDSYGGCQDLLLVRL